MKPNSIASFDEQNFDDISNEESMDMIDDYGDNMDEDEDEEDDEDEDENGSNKSTNINNSIDSSLSKSSSGDNLKKLNNKQKKRSTNNGLTLNSSNKIGRKRKSRTTFSKTQLNTLENEFLKSNFVSNDKIDLLIEMTGLDARIIKVRLLSFNPFLSNLL